MDAEELAATTMDPTRRLLVRVDVEDAATADLIFSTLMGDQVEPRRLFIEQNAKDVKFLDVGRLACLTSSNRSAPAGSSRASSRRRCARASSTTR